MTPELPPELAIALAERELIPVLGGESEASVWRCERTSAATLYLKTEPLHAELELNDEAHRLRWMRKNGLLVPLVLGYARTADAEFLLLDEVIGSPASDLEWTRTPRETVVALADGLRLIHATNIVDCPFDHRVEMRLAAARARMVEGRVREDDFDDARAGRRATDLFEELLATAPTNEDLVFTHGDYCPPNVILRREGSGRSATVVGFIDCSRAGVADRYQDLALADRSIRFNYGDEWVAPFFGRYGLDHIDRRKMEFFQLLDEFF